ncbi:MAG: hypothetical protein M1360_03185 [Candidatus Marsarchaeota archaeon]|jgi:hypothetical protein|nr:hypothetical protein [Candidatus Marsarchaeota archaeon]MCL5418916.1 hypothetical protein [Candidatus Marsarchaeota archaeon]
MTKTKFYLRSDNILDGSEVKFDRNGKAYVSNPFDVSCRVYLESSSGAVVKREGDYEVKMELRK